MKTEKEKIKQMFFMMVLTLITQICLLIRTMLVAARFDISVELDAFNYANSITVFVYSFISAGIGTVIMPNLLDDKRHKAVNTFVTLIYSICFFILIIVISFRKTIISVLTKTTGNYFIEICSNLIIVLIINQFIISILGLIQGILFSNKKFNTVKFITLVSNAIALLIFFLNKKITIYRYAYIILITSILNLVMHLLSSRKCNFKFKFNYEINTKYFNEMIINFIPIIFSNGLYQLSLMIDSTIASRLGNGQISILSYSNMVVIMINVLLIKNITNFMYPYLIESMKLGDSKKKICDYVLILNVVMWFVVSSFFVLGKDAIVLLYNHGNMNTISVNTIYICTLLYVIGLPASAVRGILYKYFYCSRDTLTPFKNSIVIGIVNSLISIILSTYIGIYGVVVGTVISSYLSLFTITIRFNKKFDNINQKMISSDTIKTIILSFVTACIVFALKTIINIDSNLMNLIFCVPIIIFVHSANLKIFKSRIFSIKI